MLFVAEVVWERSKAVLAVRQFAGQSQFAHYQVGKWVCAKQVEMPGPADRDFLRGSGQASPNVVPSPFASVTVVL